MNAPVLSVGISGELPPGHPYAELTARATAPVGLPPLVLSPTLRRERKVRVLVEAAHRALASTIAARPRALDRCALVIVTRWDGRPANLINPETNAVTSFGDMSPSSVGLQLIPHMAASCVPYLLNLRGPSVSLASREGLAAAWKIGERWLGRLADLALLIESDLALPSCVPSDLPVPHDYAIAVLIGNGDCES